MTPPKARRRAESRAELEIGPVDRLDGLVGQAAALAAGEVSSRELTERSLERIEATQPTLNAFRVVCAEQALADADAGRPPPWLPASGAPLLGVPVAIKDDVDLAGQTTPFGCAGEHRVAERDAEPVAPPARGRRDRRRQDQRARGRPVALLRDPGLRRHPQPLAASSTLRAAPAAGPRPRSRPGSSPAAMGSDGAGSIRIPAAWTNLVGLKPQRGRVSTWPDAEAFNGLSCYGPLTRDVADAALLLDVLAGNVPADRHHVPPPAEPFAARRGKPHRRAACASPSPSPPPSALPARSTPSTAPRSKALAASLAELGHEVETRDPDYGLVGAALIPRGMSAVEAWLREHEVDRAQLEPRTRVHARMGRLLSGAPLRAARAAEPALRRRIGAIFDRRRPRPHPDHGASRRPASTSSATAATGRRAPPPAPPAPSPGPGTSSAGRRSASPPASPPPACRSAPSWSPPPRARPCCSRSPPSWSSGRRWQERQPPQSH